MNFVLHLSVLCVEDIFPWVAVQGLLQTLLIECVAAHKKHSTLLGTCKEGIWAYRGHFQLQTILDA